MEKEFREKLKKLANEVIDNDMLDEDEAIEILGILRRASERSIAVLTEEYIVSQIEGENDDGSEVSGC